MVDRSPGLFDLDDRLAELSAKGDGLERVQALVDFEQCSARRSKPPFHAPIDRRAAGRPSIMC